MLEHLEIMEIPQFKNGEIDHYKKGLSFIFNDIHFSFYEDEIQFLKIYPFNNRYAVEYRAVRFSLNDTDAVALEEMIQKLKK